MTESCIETHHDLHSSCIKNNKLSSFDNVRLIRGACRLRLEFSFVFEADVPNAIVFEAHIIAARKSETKTFYQLKLCFRLLARPEVLNSFRCWVILASFKAEHLVV